MELEVQQGRGEGVRCRSECDLDIHRLKGKKGRKRSWTDSLAWRAFGIMLIGKMVLLI